MTENKGREGGRPELTARRRGLGKWARRRSGRSDEGEDEVAAVRRRWVKAQVGAGVEARWGGAGPGPSPIQSSGGAWEEAGGGVRRGGVRRRRASSEGDGDRAPPIQIQSEGVGEIEWGVG